MHPSVRPGSLWGDILLLSYCTHTLPISLPHAHTHTHTHYICTNAYKHMDTESRNALYQPFNAYAHFFLQVCVPHKTRLPLACPATSPSQGRFKPRLAADSSAAHYILLRQARCLIKWHDRKTNKNWKKIKIKIEGRSRVSPQSSAVRLVGCCA